MGLDACVYCDCFETGRLNERPPFIETIFVCPDGALDCRSEDLHTQLAFDRWLRDRACAHENGVLIHRRIGNMALVSLLRRELSRAAANFPMILEKIVYNGIHAGDFLSLDDVRSLQSELDDLRDFVCSGEREREFLDDFRRQLAELTAASLRFGKPISF
ncbi:MAG: hypothetical protein JSS81_06810 [Acidobacteria bacterium]|nr:hypothetical protein [Acidobacteriota bacterium]